MRKFILPRKTLKQFGALQSAMPPETSTPIPADGPRAVVLMDVGLGIVHSSGATRSSSAPGLNDCFSGSLSNQTSQLLERSNFVHDDHRKSAFIS